VQTISSDERNESRWTARTGWALQAIILAFAPWMLICFSLPATRDLASPRIVDDSVANEKRRLPQTRRRDISVVDTKGLAFENQITLPHVARITRRHQNREHNICSSQKIAFITRKQVIPSVLSRNNREEQITKLLVLFNAPKTTPMSIAFPMPCDTVPRRPSSLYYKKS
jgi:hypothetical protein